MTREEQIEQESYRWFLKDFYETNGGENPDQEDVENAFQRGAKWADSHPAWVSVEERLPEPNIYKEGKTFPLVLVCLTDGCVDTDAYDTDNKVWCKYDGEVEYWMVLPTPPVKEGGEQ